MPDPRPHERLVDWRTSSYSGNSGNCVEVALARRERIWRKSSRSGQNTACVEVGGLPSGAAVRDSKDRCGGHLAIDCPQWSSFVAALKRGAFDL